MSRSVSWNYELEVPAKAGAGGGIVYPLSVSEFGEHEPGEITVLDGDKECIIPDGITKLDPIDVIILIKDNFSDRDSGYTILQKWYENGGTRDVHLIARDSSGAQRMRFLLQNTYCVAKKHNNFNRKSKEELTKGFKLIPEYIEEVT